MTTGNALQIRLGIAKKHATAALEIAFVDLQDRPRAELILTALESLEEAMRSEIREVMEDAP